MFFSWVIASYRFWCQRGISRLIAAFGSLFIATVPIFFEHATIGYADLTFACYIGLGVLWGLEGIFAQNWHYQVISGISLGLVCWTRAEGILYSIALVLTMMIAWRIVGQGRPKLLPWLLPIAVIGLTWLLFAHQDISSGNLGGAVRAALLGLGQREFNLDALALILIHILNQVLVANYWGLLFPLGCILFFMTRHNLYPKGHPHAFALMLVLVVTSLLPIGLFYVGSFNSNLSYFQGWMERSFDRAFIPALLLMGNLMILVGMLPSTYGEEETNRSSDIFVTTSNKM
jgi:hypothetical protein